MDIASVIGEVDKRFALVVPGFWIGAAADATSFPGRTVISVMNWYEPRSRADTIWIPVVRIDTDSTRWPIVALPKNLEIVAELIERYRSRGGVFVHCREGRERAPLAAAWYLRYRRRPLMPWKAAYKLIRRTRPSAVDRSHWIPR